MQQEIYKLIEAIRETYPDQKILLASEFIKRRHPLINPLHVTNAKQDLHSYAYNQIPDLAKKLNIDTLALEDNVFQLTSDGWLIQAGDSFVRMDKNPHLDDLISNVVSIYMEEILEGSTS